MKVKQIKLLLSSLFIFILISVPSSSRETLLRQDVSFLFIIIIYFGILACIERYNSLFSSLVSSYIFIKNIHQLDKHLNNRKKKRLSHKNERKK
jgi:hypothetical protein